MDNRIFMGNQRYVSVAGDLHGDYNSYREVLRLHEGAAKHSLLLFLGDYADRGQQGVEIISELNRLLDMRDDVVALKGNHEIYRDGRPLFSPCDLIGEAERKYGSWHDFYKQIFSVFLSKLYVAAIINHVLFIHAGLFSGIGKAEDLTSKENEPYLLWSDPSPDPGEHMNMRGAGVLFGEDVTERVLASLGVKLVIRSHEPRKAAAGPYQEHGGKIITTNSCNSYDASLRPFILNVDTERLSYKPIYLQQS